MGEARRIHSVFVELEGEVLSYQYMCREGDTVPPLATFRKPVRIQEVKELAEGLAGALLKRASSELGGGGALREWGGKLYDKVIPGELAEKLATDKSSSYLVLYLDPAVVWLPWELLWDGEDFLSQRFRIARLLQKTAQELHAAEQRLRETRSGRGALIVFGDVSGLDAHSEKAEVENALGPVYGSNIWFYTARGATDILEQLKRDYEVCHFIGHGRYVPDSPGETGWKFADGTVLTCGDIEGVSSRASFPLLIFANSCDSAHSSFAEGEGYVSALYRAFLRQGVPHYIGTASPVPDEAAKDFARSHWRLVAQGLSVGEALGETRRVFRERPGIPVWASYVHYGDPTYRIIRETRETSYESGRWRGRQEAVREKTSFSVLGRLSQEEIHRMLDHYKSAIAKDTNDGEAYYGLALCYLQLGLYDLTIKNFKQTLELMPEYADAYYYYGISLIRGRRPKLLSLNEVRLIEQYLTTAMQLDDRQAKYYYLAAVLKFDYYAANGLTVHPPLPEDLLELAENKEHNAWEVERLFYAVPVRHEGLIALIHRHHETLER